MKWLLKLEELALLGLSIYAFSLARFDWWWYPALFLAPDLGMIGYLAGNRIGATTYNLTHHRAVALALCAAGVVLEVPSLMLVGIVFFGHSAFDRVLGYGLKLKQGFKFTHLGVIGKGSGS